jgi:uncharacterized surface protein with fasciclin (FAS1) repeats
MTTQPTLPTIAVGVRSSRSITTCARLLALAGLNDLLQGEERYTLFAPTDKAFDALPPGTLQTLESDPAQLRSVLEYHIVSVDRDLSQIRDAKLSTVQGTLITASVTDDGLQLDHANTSGYPINCANGVIQPIDAVLFPGFKPTASAPREESAWSGQRQSSRVYSGPVITAAEAAEALFKQSDSGTT